MLIILQNILLAITVLIAALTQSTSGFGFGIVFMAIMPIFWPFKECVVISLTTGLFLQLITITRLHKYINWHLVIYPTIGAIIGGTIGVHLMVKMNKDIVNLILGLFLWTLAIYMIFIAKRVHLRKTFSTAIGAGLLGGFMGGMFSIGGPPMVAYYDSIINDTLIYQSTIQTYFSLTTLNNLFNNFLCGNISIKLLSPLCITLIFCFIGTIIGIKISSKISMKTVRKIAYAVMMLAGTYDLIKAFIY